MAGLYDASQGLSKTISRCRLADFHITVTGQEPPFHVTARYRAHTGEGRFYSHAAQPQWQEYLARLAQLDVGEEALTTVGAHLFQELFQDELWELWLKARSDLERSPEAGLRLRLQARPPGVAALPWECLYDPDRQRSLGAHARLALVRTATSIRHVGYTRDLAADFPLKLLLVAVEDPNGQMDTRAEARGIQEQLEKLGPRQVTLTQLRGRVHLAQLRRTLLDVQPDILHLITHGEPDRLLLWDETQTHPEWIAASSWQALLEQAETVRLVFLNACLAGQPTPDAPFASVAQRLLQAGAPGVIAMQFSVPDRAAVAFAGHLYENLVSGPCPGAVDLAVSRARHTLYLAAPGRVDYAVPLLWLNAEDGRIFRLASQGEAVRGEAEGRTGVESLSPPPLPSPSVSVDLAALEAYLDQQPAFDPAQLTLDQQAILRSRNEALDEARRILAQLRRLDQEQARGLPRQRPMAAALERFRQAQAQIDRLTGLLRKLLG